jgi:hypothetical protein
VENLWIEWVAWSEGQKQIPAGITTRRATTKARATARAATEKRRQKAKGCAMSAAFSDLYISILVN